MAKASENVPFPIKGLEVRFPPKGEGSTLAVRSSLPMHLLSLSGVEIEESWSSRDFTWPHWRLYLNLDDGAFATVRGRRTEFKAGHLYVVPAWLTWSGECRGTVRHFNGSVDLPSLSRDSVRAACREVALLATPESELGRTWLSLARSLARGTETRLTDLARGHAAVWSALAVYFDLLGAAADRLVPKTFAPELSDVLWWIESRLGEALRRIDIARAAQVSEAELARRFSTHLGTSPARWVRDRRLAKASELLRTSDDPIERIAEICGFGDRTRMSKVFTRGLGQGPGAYRRRYGGGKDVSQGTGGGPPPSLGRLRLRS